MMDDKIISFTKLGTVKSKNFEYTYADFITMMNKFVTHNVESYKVTYNPNEECFEVVFKGTKYQVYYGKEKLSQKSERKDLVEQLNRLVNRTKKQTVEREAQKLLEEKEQRKLEDIIKNGDKGIFYSNEDKKKYLEYKEKNSEKTSLTKGLLKDALKFIRKYRFDWGSLVTSVILVFVGTGLGVTSVITQELCVGLVLSSAANLIIGFISAFISMLRSDISDSNSRIYSPLYLIVAALLGLGKMGKDLVGRISKRMKNNKKLRLLEQSINGTIITHKPISEKEEVVEEVKVEEKPKEESALMQQALKEFVLVHDKILKIKDKGQKTQFAKELLEITNSYKEEIDKNNGNNFVVHKNLFDQIISLDFRVEQVLKKEEEAKSTKEEFNTLIEEVDRKSMGAR